MGVKFPRIWAVNESMATYRARVEYEPYPEADWLEQWDTPEKYYGGAPECPECKCGMDYVRDHLWQCSDNRDEYNGDCDAPLFEWKGTDKGGQVRDGEKGPIIPFDEYKRTYGDPDNYVFLCAVVEMQCECCGEWPIRDSLGGISFYEPAPDHWETGSFTEADVADMPEGYFKETLLGMFDEAKSKAA